MNGGLSSTFSEAERQKSSLKRAEKSVLLKWTIRSINRKEVIYIMKKCFVVLLSLFLSLSFFMAAGCKKGEESAEAPKPEAPVKASEVKENDDYFQRAYDSFVKKDLKASATDIKEGAEILEQEAEQATADSKKALSKSAHELEQLAEDVETGTAISENKLKGIFARAEQALAEQNYLKASEAWTQKKTKETGSALENAALHLERAVQWTGTVMSIGTASALNNARNISGKLMQDVGWGYEDVAEGIKALGDEISETGKNIESANR